MVILLNLVSLVIAHYWLQILVWLVQMLVGLVIADVCLVIWLYLFAWLVRFDKSFCYRLCRLHVNYAAAIPTPYMVHVMNLFLLPSSWQPVPSS
jgi:hypothetical protein